jgi:hypothetical protein
MPNSLPHPSLPLDIPPTPSVTALQPVKSFKLRGAYNRMAQLTPEQRDRGVICSSAGNHAQGVALAAARMVSQRGTVPPSSSGPGTAGPPAEGEIACSTEQRPLRLARSPPGTPRASTRRRLRQNNPSTYTPPHPQGCSAVICMPVTTPDIKVSAVRALGGDVQLVGESYQEAQAAAQLRAEAEGLAFIAPYDDPYTIAGQVRGCAARVRGAGSAWSGPVPALLCGGVVSPLHGRRLCSGSAGMQATQPARACLLPSRGPAAGHNRHRDHAGV